MGKGTRGLLAALATAALLALGTATATANRLATNARTFRLDFAPVGLVMSVGLAYCDLTLDGSFHTTTIQKIARSLIGSITRGTIEFCTQGTATLLTETLPWHVTYSGFSGVLPNITAMRVEIIGLAINLNVGGIACLLRSDASEPVVGSFRVEARGTVTTFDLDALANIDLDDPSFVCNIAGNARLSGLGSVYQPGSGEPLTIRLV